MEVRSPDQRSVFSYVRPPPSVTRALRDSFVEVADTSEAGPIRKSPAQVSSPALVESKSSKVLEFPLSLLQSQPKCEVYPELHRIIQV